MGCDRMADQPRYADTGDETGVEPESSEGMPRWVKVLAGIGIVLIMLAVLMVSGVFGGEHGPRRHRPASGADAAAATVLGEQAFGGGHDPSMGDHG